MTGLRVTVADVRAARLCTRGMRTWLREHHIDLNTFILEGMPIEEAEATGDAYALHICERVRAAEAMKNDTGEEHGRQ